MRWAVVARALCRAPPPRVSPVRSGRGLNEAGARAGDEAGAGIRGESGAMPKPGMADVCPPKAASLR